jgi:hypothetical protein
MATLADPPFVVLIASFWCVLSSPARTTYLIKNMLLFPYRISLLALLSESVVGGQNIYTVLVPRGKNFESWMQVNERGFIARCQAYCYFLRYRDLTSLSMIVRAAGKCVHSPLHL